MSGIESLLPYIDKKRKGESPTIIIDSREAKTAPKIFNGLIERGVNVKSARLVKGDYILSDQCAVERKTVTDFVYTLTRRHLFDQLFKLKEMYTKSMIVLEGYLPIIYKFSNIKPASVWGAMFNLAKNGISFINTKSYKETADFLCVAAKQEQIVEKRNPTIHPFKKNDTLSNAQMFLLSSLPNIGGEKARSILKAYQTPLKAFIKVDDWSNRIHGLGPIITKKVKKVLEGKFEE